MNSIYRPLLGALRFTQPTKSSPPPVPLMEGDKGGGICFFLRPPRPGFFICAISEIWGFLLLAIYHQLH